MIINIGTLMLNGKTLPQEILDKMIKNAKFEDDIRRNAHEIRRADSPLVQLAIFELGETEVRNISYDQRYCMGIASDTYLDRLRSRLGDAYLADTSKTHLREYVDYKFGADLGL